MFLHMRSKSLAVYFCVDEAEIEIRTCDELAFCTVVAFHLFKYTLCYL